MSESTSMVTVYYVMQQSCTIQALILIFSTHLISALYVSSLTAATIVWLLKNNYILIW